jgi:hypothetical protein
MRQALLFVLSLASFSLSGCASRVSSNPADYVGEYVFMPANSSPPARFASFVVLKPDHEAVEIKSDPHSGVVQTKTETWYLSHSTGQNVVIGDFSCPVEVSRSEIRLIVNDLGQYYEKVR